MLDSPLWQPLSRSSLVFLLVFDDLLHTPRISSPNHHLLFAAHAHTSSPQYWMEIMALWTTNTSFLQNISSGFAHVPWNKDTSRRMHWECLSGMWKWQLYCSIITKAQTCRSTVVLQKLYFHETGFITFSSIHNLSRTKTKDTTTNTNSDKH